MKQILISPWSRKLHTGKKNPKNYPYWPEVITLLKKQGNVKIIQIGINGEEKLDVDEIKFNRPIWVIEELLKTSDVFISVDNFLPHLAHLIRPINGLKCARGVVIFGQSDPKIFGYTDNINLLRDRKYLKKNQFGVWYDCEYIKEAFVLPQSVVGVC